MTNSISPFSENAFFVNAVSKRQQIGNNIQGIVLSFVSAELIKNQRLKVSKKLDLIGILLQLEMNQERKFFLKQILLKKLDIRVIVMF